MRASITIAGFLAVLMSTASAYRAPQARNNCLKTCLVPYGTNATRTIKTICRRACKVAAPLRRSCRKTTNTFWRNQTKVCRQSIRRIKQGLPPLTSLVSHTTPANASSDIPTVTQYTYEATCLKEIKFEWKDAKQTCREILCPDGQYWNVEADACVVNTFVNLSVLETSGALDPAFLRGFYKMSWKGTDPYQGPDDTNVGVTFTGRLPGDAQANIAPMTSDAINLLSYGGGNEFGAWSVAAVEAVGSESNLNEVISLKYDGIVIDAEEYASGQSVSVEQWNTMFAAIKAKNLMLIVTTSHFSPYGMSNGAALVADWLSNPNIDYISPQLYTSGTEPQNDWEGFSAAWTTASTPIAPSIVQASYYDQLAENSVTAYLPKAKGYLVWSNTPPPQPGPTPSCVSGYFPVRARRPHFSIQ